jgi:hypothetical protein
MTDTTTFEKPYYVETDGLPGLDFNREIIPPGTNEAFPEGAIGIRVDGDFWAVAALPYSYLEKPLPEIVKEFWPQYMDTASFKAESGSVEQKIEFATEWAESQEHTIRYLNERNHELEDQLMRLRAGRYDLHERHYNRHRAFNDYFVRQYEHLLIAMAHNAEPRANAAGVCERCGLLVSDRVHHKHYLDLHAKGYDFGIDAICQTEERIESTY